MPRIEDQEMITRKILPMIYSIDTSGSMAGDRIASVNEAMRETKQILDEVSVDNPDAEIRIAVQTFSSGASWVTKKLEKLEDYYWNNVTAGGCTDLGDAIKAISNKLSKSEFLKGEIGFNLPVVIFMSDGGPTDGWERALHEANNNKFFKKATKIAIAIGDGADIGILGRLVGNVEAVIRVTDVETLKKLIKIVSQTASMTGSKVNAGTDGSDTTVGGEIVKEVVTKVEGTETFDSSAWS